MKFIDTKIPEVKIIKPRVYNDKRGYFFESFRSDLFKENIADVDFVQSNESKSIFGVLRGIHFQKPPMAQSKLVRVVKGKVQDIAVDLRKNSQYFGQYVSVVLSGENKKQLFIPKGFGHAYLTLSEEAIFAYKVDNYYSSEKDTGIIYNDSDINIDWLLDNDEIKLSGKDKNLPQLKTINIEVFK